MLRQEYLDRKQAFLRMTDLVQQAVLLAQIQDDIAFLESGYIAASKLYTKRLNTQTCGRDTLKESAWDVVEYQELMRQAQAFQIQFEECRSHAATYHMAKLTKDSFFLYLKNIYKKKRTAASHVLVIMVAEEKRNKKPYAVPVQYIPYYSIRDQQLRDVLCNIKQTMTAMGMTVVGKC